MKNKIDIDNIEFQLTKNHNKTKFEQARDEFANEIYNYSEEDVISGANWGAAYEREKAKKLVEAIFSVTNDIDYENYKKLSNAIKSYEGED